MSVTSKKNLVPILVIIMFFWALIHPLSKMVVADVSSALLAFLRLLLGALALFVVLWFRKEEFRVKKEDVLPLFMLGVVGTALASLFMFIGIDLSNATNASILVNINPIFVALLAPLLIHEKLERKQVLGILISFVGMYLVVTNGVALTEIIKTEYFTGNIALIGAAACITAYTIYGKKYIEKYGGLIATFYTLLAGSIFLLVYTFATGDIYNVLNISLNEWLVIGFIGVIITGFVWSIWYGSIKIIGATRASSFKLLIPVFATAAAILMLGESPSVFVISGGLIVVAGLALTQKAV